MMFTQGSLINRFWNKVHQNDVLAWGCVGFLGDISFQSMCLHRFSPVTIKNSYNSNIAVQVQQYRCIQRLIVIGGLRTCFGKKHIEFPQKRSSPRKCFKLRFCFVGLRVEVPGNFRIFAYHTHERTLKLAANGSSGAKSKPQSIDRLIVCYHHDLT